MAEIFPRPSYWGGLGNGRSHYWASVLNTSLRWPISLPSRAVGDVLMMAEVDPERHS